MRRTPTTALAALCALSAAPAAAASVEGGAVPPQASGGTSYGQTITRGAHRPGEAPKRRRHRARRHRRARRSGPLLTSFELARPRLFLYGRPARVSFVIRARERTVRVRLYVLPESRGRPVRTIFLGARPAGVLQSVFMTGREAGELPQGRYRLRIAATDSRGRRLRRAPAASSTVELAFFHHRFPLAGPFSYGGPDARFGAPRKGHRHQGQDLAAAEGTPVVAPRGGTVKAVQYQARGAGHYVVLDGAGENRDYVFMHLKAGSIRMREGESVRTGQRLGDVGNTGRSFGAHLHFEVWVGGWYAGGHPIDPLPLLRGWDSWS